MAFTRKNVYVKRGRGTRKMFSGARATAPRSRVIAKAVNKQWRKKVAKVAKAVVARTEEKKYSVSYGTHGLGTNQYTGFTNENILDPNRYLLQPIQQGPGENQRIGNYISIKSCWLKGVLYPHTPNFAQQGSQLMTPFEVKMWVLSDRKNPNTATQSDIYNATLNEIFENGSTDLGFSNSINDIVQTINRERFMVYYQRTFKVGTAEGSTNNNSVSFNNWNNDFKLNCKFAVNLGRYMPKRVVYTTTGIIPFVKKIFVVFQVVYANGFQVTSSQTIPFVDLDWSMILKYTDS